MDLTITSEIRNQLYAGGITKILSWGAHAWAVIDETVEKIPVYKR